MMNADQQLNFIKYRNILISEIKRKGFIFPKDEISDLAILGLYEKTRSMLKKEANMNMTTENMKKFVRSQVNGIDGQNTNQLQVSDLEKCLKSGLSAFIHKKVIVELESLMTLKEAVKFLNENYGWKITLASFKANYVYGKKKKFKTVSGIGAIRIMKKDLIEFMNEKIKVG